MRHGATMAPMTPETPADKPATEARLAELLAAMIALEPAFRGIRAPEIRAALERVKPSMPDRPLTDDDVDALLAAVQEIAARYRR